MYCAKCGFQNSDQSMYCQKCGAPLSRQNGNGGGYRRSVSPVLRAANMVGSEGIAGALRRLILSPLYLVAAIALSTQVVMYILASVAGSSPLMGAIYSILNNSELGYYMDYSQFYQILGMMNRTSAVGAIISNIPTIAIVAALWILYAQAHNTMQQMNTTGITIIRIVQIIRLVLYGLGLLLGIIGVLISIAALGDYIDNFAVIAILIILFIAIFGSLTVIYYLQTIKLLGSANDIILRGQKTSQASLYVIVLTFIAGGFQCISAFGSLFSAGIIAFLSNAAMATSSIAFGLLMNKFNLLEAFGTGARPVNAEVNIRITPTYDEGAEKREAGNKAFSGIPAYIPPKPGTVVMPDDEEEIKRRRFADEGTMVLSENLDMPPAKLVRARDQKEICISKPEFTIGKGYGSVDGFIEDNPAISRKHAKIVLNEGKFYLIDTNSTNHVFVDVQMIPANTPVLLKDGMNVRFADDLFKFYES